MSADVDYGIRYSFLVYQFWFFEMSLKIYIHSSFKTMKNLFLKKDKQHNNHQKWRCLSFVVGCRRLYATKVRAIDLLSCWQNKRVAKHNGLLLLLL